MGSDDKTGPQEATILRKPEEVVAENVAICEREYKLYHSERAERAKTELSAENRYEQLLIALSAGALGISITLVKDWVGRDNATCTALLLVSWIAFASCLLICLWHHKLTFETHRDWREILDDEFSTSKWSPGAMGRAIKRYDDIPNIDLVERLKTWALWSLLAGIVLLGVFLTINYAKGHPNESSSAQSQPQSTASPVAATGARTAAAGSVSANSATPPATAPKKAITTSTSP